MHRMMRRSCAVVLFAGVGLLGAVGVRADVIVRLHSGAAIRAIFARTDGERVKLQLQNGVVAVPSAAVASIDETAPSEFFPMAGQAAAPAPAAALSSEIAAAPKPNGTMAGREGPPPAPVAAVDAGVPEVKGEEVLTKMQRLDDLLLRTHRQLSIARTQEQPPETLDALERKIAEINRQRAQATARLRSLH